MAAAARCFFGLRCRMNRYRPASIAWRVALFLAGDVCVQGGSHAKFSKEVVTGYEDIVYF
jgi:hypothetical protein